MSTIHFNQWFHALLDRPASAAPTAQLFCFPYAGAGPSSYHAFCKALPAHILPFVARLPGRETTRHLPALTDLHDIVTQLARAIRPALDRQPVFFWGHSMGALVAFEVARLLGPQLGPRRLIVSGHKAPQMPLRPRPVPVTEMNDAQFIDLLQSYGGMPQAVLDNPEVLQLLLPQLKADFMALDRYRYVPGERLECGILCVNGESDRLVAEPQALAWREQTRGGFGCKWLPGAHFFINESRPALVRIIDETIAEELVRLEADLPEGH
ncbi:alpha/beta fold hydrolase [Aquabacterium sp. A7-Y]|uniref:thioesterase II family protein n=1 Tax=Aquabacterium sp. A7-Y TaxID=1349605 RepID=UPI00223E0158|nr:alpha/beta fold hydrolase [Aquabacterium sp. A7-Y]MCW7538532.1 alpha/beta fold hydrolase [Aquabacterium sp. A7-Y]